MSIQLLPSSKFKFHLISNKIEDWWNNFYQWYETILLVCYKDHTISHCWKINATCFNSPPFFSALKRVKQVWWWGRRKKKNLNFFKEWVFASNVIPSPPSSQISKERPFSQKKICSWYLLYTTLYRSPSYPNTRLCSQTKNGLHTSIIY